MRRFRVVLLATATAIGFACSQFSTETPAPSEPDGGGTDGPVAPPPPSDDASPGDAGQTEAGLECTPSAAPSCAPDTCATRTLYLYGGGYPFGITSDAAHVYWIEQVNLQDGGGDPYNGDGAARILRTDRSGAADASRAAILASNVIRATTIALDPPYVYTVGLDATDGGPLGARLFRVRTDCAPASCVTEELAFTSPMTGVRIFQLHRAAPNVLFARRENGELFRIAISGMSATPTSVDTTPTYSGSVVTDQAAYLAGSATATLHRISLNGAQVDPSFVAIPPLADAGTGVVALATDCDNVYGTRSTATTDMIMRISLAAKTASPVTGPTGYSFFALGADARYVYGAAVNAGGLIAIDPVDGGVRNVRAANVFALWVDDQGVYFGDHSGTGRLMMMVK